MGPWWGTFPSHTYKDSSSKNKCQIFEHSLEKDIRERNLKPLWRKQKPKKGATCVTSENHMRHEISLTCTKMCGKNFLNIKGKAL